MNEIELRGLTLAKRFNDMWSSIVCREGRLNVVYRAFFLLRFDSGNQKKFSVASFTQYSWQRATRNSRGPSRFCRPICSVADPSNSIKQ